MRFSTALFACVSVALGAAAQSVNILAPAADATFAAGDSFIVDVNRPNTLTGSQEVSVVIALGSCVGRSPAHTCEGVDLSNAVGRVLYAGPYAPELRKQNREYSQDFNVTVPANFPKGASVLSVAHFSLVGAGPWPLLEVVNRTLTIQ